MTPRQKPQASLRGHLTFALKNDLFIKPGFRQEGGFVGSHDRENQMPLPDHISARHEDLNDLITGIVAFDRTSAKTLDPVIVSAVFAFGFVYIHPFEDGNGYLHRYIFHHVWAERGFNPPGSFSRSRRQFSNG